MKNLISARDLDRKQIVKLLDLADDIAVNSHNFLDVLKNLKMATLFFEPSTRTKLSFTSAMYELGGQVLDFNSDGSSLKKDESLYDTIKTINHYVDLLVIRHKQGGIVQELRQYATVPIINAGDGKENHPTQMLTDLLCIRRNHNRLDNLVIGICGDLKHSRAIQSLLQGLSLFKKIKVIAIASIELQLDQDQILDFCNNSDITFELTGDLENNIDKLDVLYMTRMQKERFAKDEVIKDYSSRLCLNKEKLSNAKKSLIVMHPLPRNQEISADVDSSAHAKYFEQVLCGKQVRKALLVSMLENNNPLT